MSSRFEGIVYRVDAGRLGSSRLPPISASPAGWRSLRTARCLSAIARERSSGRSRRARHVVRVAAVERRGVPPRARPRWRRCMSLRRPCRPTTRSTASTPDGDVTSRHRHSAVRRASRSTRTATLFVVEALAGVERPVPRSAGGATPSWCSPARASSAWPSTRTAAWSSVRTTRVSLPSRARSAIGLTGVSESRLRNPLRLNPYRSRSPARPPATGRSASR